MTIGNKFFLWKRIREACAKLTDLTLTEFKKEIAIGLCTVNTILLCEGRPAVVLKTIIRKRECRLSTYLTKNIRLDQTFHWTTSTVERMRCRYPNEKIKVIFNVMPNVKFSYVYLKTKMVLLLIHNL